MRRSVKELASSTLPSSYSKLSFKRATELKNFLLGFFSKSFDRYMKTNFTKFELSMTFGLQDIAIYVSH